MSIYMHSDLIDNTLKTEINNLHRKILHKKFKNKKVRQYI